MLAILFGNGWVKIRIGDRIEVCKGGKTKRKEATRSREEINLRRKNILAERTIELSRGRRPPIFILYPTEYCVAKQQPSRDVTLIKRFYVPSAEKRLRPALGDQMDPYFVGQCVCCHGSGGLMTPSFLPDVWHDVAGACWGKSLFAGEPITA